MIDTKRLATDAGYWRECGAPNPATHYDKAAAFFCNDRGYWNDDGDWRKLDQGHGMWGSSRYIPRPQSEWVDGFPPIGTLCECQMGSYWYEVEVIGATKEAVWARPKDRSDYWTIMNGLSLRPIPAKAQRERDELADLIADNIQIDMVHDSFHVGAGKAVDAIIAAGWRKEQ